MISEINKYRLRSIMSIAAWSALISAPISGFVLNLGWVGFFNGFFIGGLAAALIRSFGLYVMDARYRRLSIPAAFAIDYSAYLAITMAIAFPIITMTRVEITNDILLFTIVMCLGISFVFTAVISIMNIVGSRELINLLIGRYNRPSEEERLFLFMDLRNSTLIAESVGDACFLDFLNDAFGDVTEAVMVYHAEIYRYIGDEIIVTWKIGRKKEVPVLKFYNLVAETIRRRSDHYIQKYGVIPVFRGAAHAGRVVVGQLGIKKKEIAYLGDVLNVCARLETESKAQNLDMAISEEVRQHLQDIELGHLENLGPVTLRGKERAVTIYGYRTGNVSIGAP